MLLRRFTATIALLPLFALTSWAFSLQPKSNGMPRSQKNESRHVIDRLEDKWRVAVLKNDATVLDSLLADDYVAIMANGTLSTKEQTLSAIRAGQWRLTTLEVSDRKVRFYGRTALVTSLVHVEGNGPGGSATGSYRYTRVYARDARGNWKIVNFEANRIGPPSHATPSDAP